MGIVTGKSERGMSHGGGGEAGKEREKRRKIGIY